MNRLRQRINTSRHERHQRKQDALVDYIHNPDSQRALDDLKTSDAEILGNSKELRHAFRDRYRYTADRLEKKANKLEQENTMLNGAVQLENYTSKRGSDLAQQKAKENRQAVEKAVKGRRERYLDFRSNRTKIKIERVQSKLNNSSDSFLAQQINRQRRHKLKELGYKQKIYKHYSSKLERSRLDKPEELRKKIDKIVKEKVDAAYRKAQRQELRRNKIGRHDFAKRAEFVAKMSPATKKKITRDAILLVRKKNIERGRLGMNHQVDHTLDTRKVTNEYGRTIK